MKKTASIFIPHYGCPNDCIFCNQVKISGKKTKLDYQDIIDSINLSLSTMNEEDVVEIAFFGGSFTAIEDEVQEKCLDIANDFRRKLAQKVEIKISTRPDAINDVVIDRLKKYDVNTVELGVQSLDDEVLFFSNRGHSSKDVFIASDMIKNASISLGIQIMIGLPYDSKQKFYNTVEKVISIKPDVARIYPVLVIKDTYLEHMYNNGLYKTLDLQEAVDLTKYIYKNLEKSNIKVIRIGLQATQNINFGKDIVAGPFHSAFGELVISELYKDKIEDILLKNKFTQDEFIIKTPKKYISKILGNKKKNYIYFKEKYNMSIKIQELNQDYIEIFGIKISNKDIFI